MDTTQPSEAGSVPQAIRDLVRRLTEMIANLSNDALRERCQAVLAIPRITEVPVYSIILRDPLSFIEFVRTGYGETSQVSDTTITELRTTIQRHIRRLRLPSRTIANVVAEQLRTGTIVLPGHEAAGARTAIGAANAELAAFNESLLRAVEGTPAHALATSLPFEFNLFAAAALAGRDEPVVQGALPAPQRANLMQLRGAFLELVVARRLLPLPGFVAGFHRERGAPADEARIGGLAFGFFQEEDDGELFLEAPLSSPESQAAPFPGFQPSRDASAEPGDGESEAYWPAIQQWIHSDRSAPKPRVLCVFCTTELLVPELLGEGESGSGKEAMRKLTCGHVVGDVCAEQWPRCPFCSVPV